MKYKTRGMSTPQGKPRVYFSAHPKDYGRCFQKISDSILACTNCAVWYAQKQETGDVHWENLKQMQLFVIPVTRELLIQPNAAMDAEIPFAMEHHIPVLPLMQERGLEKYYQEKFGDLQYLDETDEDPTAIRYEEKLMRYLSSILVGDELANQIRAAFDAYLFLSYRKKDRTHAQDLMRLIHKQDHFRDIAIWYDEFLVPGEDFNDAIGTALKKSDLLVLAVTPNLVNEKNYIMTTEYPMAVQAGKPVLPAVLVPTDQARLAAQYRQIPPCVHVYENGALAEALAEKARELGLQERAASPEHDFFIGMAYLAGVDVEVDTHRGIELITGAAEADVAEAIDMLIIMHRTGYGVERSREHAFRWQEKKLALRQRQYRQKQTADTLDRLVEELCRCADHAREDGRLSQAAQYYTAAQTALEHSNFRNDPRILRDRAMICHRLSDICLLEGDTAAAKSAAGKGLAITEELAKHGKTEQVERYLADGYLKLGDIHCSEGDPEKALVSYEKCLTIRSTVEKETGSMDARRDLMIVCNRMGAAAQSQGARKLARAYYEQSLVLGDVLKTEAGTIRAQRDHAICCNRLADIAQEEGDGAAAILYSRQYVEASEKIAEADHTVQARRDLYVSYQKYGEVLYALGKWEKAKDYFEKGHRLCEALGNELHTVELYADLAVSYYRLSLTASVFQRLKYRKKAIDMGEELCRRYPEVALYRQYLHIFRNFK